MKRPPILSERHRPILFCQEIILCSRILKRTFSPLQATTSGRFIPKRDISSTKADKNRPDTVRTAAGYRDIGKTGQPHQTGIAAGPVSTGWRDTPRNTTADRSAAFVRQGSSGGRDFGRKTETGVRPSCENAGVAVADKTGRHPWAPQKQGVYR